MNAGFIDVQVNGHDDVDVATATDEEWPRLLSLLAAQGVTSWCPTLITAPLPLLEQRLAAVSARVGAEGPDLVGVHLEGPFLGSAHGAHPGVQEGPVDLDWLARLPDIVRIVTLGPERDKAPAAIEALVARGVVAALGHTEASSEVATRAVDAGATLFTHAFNASGCLHHREPGALGVALTDDRLVISLITDGIHVDPSMIKLAWRAKPAGGVVLITDGAAWRTGRLADAGVQLVDGAPRLANGTLAGSALRLNDAVRYCVEVVGIELVDALAAASSTPARVLGLEDRGAIASGQRGDLVALDENLEVAATWVNGDLVTAQPAGEG